LQSWEQLEAPSQLSWHEVPLHSWVQVPPVAQFVAQLAPEQDVSQSMESAQSITPLAPLTDTMQCPAQEMEQLARPQEQEAPAGQVHDMASHV
jgi:hypothetical protein